LGIVPTIAISAPSVFANNDPPGRLPNTSIGNLVPSVQHLLLAVPWLRSGVQKVSQIGKEWVAEIEGRLESALGSPSAKRRVKWL
jgi:hypothetical protein